MGMGAEMNDADRYELDTILAGIAQIKREQANLRAMLTDIWMLLCPELPVPQAEDREALDS